MSTSNYFRKANDDVVTQYSIQRPKGKAKTAPNRSGEGVAPPPCLKLILPSGKVFQVSTEREISIGRRSRPADPEVTVDLQEHGGVEGGVSRYHAMIVVVKGVLYLRDLNSVNGTFLNGHRLMPIASYPVKDGDILTLGELSMTVEYC
jgi:pSer/pThr/pTyr-binding forkhead associated (FHA) protein